MSTPLRRLTEDELKQQDADIRNVIQNYKGREPMTIRVMVGAHFYELRYSRSLIDPDIRCIGPVSDNPSSNASVESPHTIDQ